MQISGTVKEGLKLAGERGMATANIESDLDIGVYTGETNLGGCLIFVAKPPKTEIHIIGYNSEMYGEFVSVYNIKRIPQIITDLAHAINKEN